LGQETFLTIWPNGTSLTANGDGVVIPDVGTVRLGEPVRTGGAYVSPPITEAASAPEIPPECLPAKGKEIAIIESKIQRG
jgi:hypothetical protein